MFIIYIIYIIIITSVNCCFTSLRLRIVFCHENSMIDESGIQYAYDLHLLDENSFIPDQTKDMLLLNYIYINSKIRCCNITKYIPANVTVYRAKCLREF